MDALMAWLTRLPNVVALLVVWLIGAGLALAAGLAGWVVVLFIGGRL